MDDTITTVITSGGHPRGRAGDASTAEPRRTFRPAPGDEPIGPRRRMSGATAEDTFNLTGALGASLAVATLLFGWFTPMTGAVGWAIVTYLLFIVIYAMLVALRATGQEVTDRVMTALLYSAASILIAALVFVVCFAVFRGLPALVNLNSFVQTMESAGPLEPLSVGGIAHAIVGTLIQISIALSITVPLGIATAVFMNEIGGRFARFVRTISDAMTALPSIVAGLFVYSAVIQLITHERSGFAASLAITVMMLPIVIRASDVVLRLVPGNLREASYALGASRWKTVWHVVLPTARSGLVTAVILGTARGIGETSPVLLTSGVTAVMNVNPFSGPMISLPLQVFDFVKSPEPNMIARGFGAAATLILLVLLLFIVARIIGGRGPGQLSGRQRRARSAQSAADLARIESRQRHAGAAALPNDPTPSKDLP
ncbi:phosphate ABC transporter permease PstA [Microbacterium sp. 1P10AE]|uniref:phosphate ABC transporter permease PstA n=1 Tax=Microbacterium sp. 1P10AE TaxID=3132286 RepID=UPI0039A12E71